MKNVRERVLQLRAQNWKYNEIAAELRLTKGQVAGILGRDRHAPEPIPEPARTAPLESQDDRDLWILQLACDGWSLSETAFWLSKNGWPDTTAQVVNGILARDRGHFPKEPLRRGDFQ